MVKTETWIILKRSTQPQDQINAIIIQKHRKCASDLWKYQLVIPYLTICGKDELQLDS